MARNERTGVTTGGEDGVAPPEAFGTAGALVGQGLKAWLEPALLALTLAAFLAGLVVWALGGPTVAEACWMPGTVLAIVPALAWVVALCRAWTRRRMSISCPSVRLRWRGHTPPT
jgi:peptidoglycan/LPS O-acetylase OafA/YrhL